MNCYLFDAKKLLAPTIYVVITICVSQWPHCIDRHTDRYFTRVQKEFTLKSLLIGQQSCHEIALNGQSNLQVAKEDW